MTDQEIIIECAKLDGLEPNGADPLLDGWYRKGMFIPTQPMYLSSRDATIPVIEKQPPDVLFKIGRIIKDETCHSTPTLAGILATPRQLCIALLKATGGER